MRLSKQIENSVKLMRSQRWSMPADILHDIGQQVTELERECELLRKVAIEVNKASKKQPHDAQAALDACIEANVIVWD